MKIISKITRELKTLDEGTYYNFVFQMACRLFQNHLLTSCLMWRYMSYEMFL